MGMYTALSLGVELNIKEDSDEAKILGYMVGLSAERPEVLPDHPFFRCGRWAILLRCDSYYFDYDTRFTLRWDAIARGYFLSGVSNLKNYDGEISKFLDWLAPYIADSTCGFIGWTMYEESEFPVVLLRRDRKTGPAEIVWLRIEELVDMIDKANMLIESLMPGAGQCVLNVGMLDAFFTKQAALEKELSYDYDDD